MSAHQVGLIFFGWGLLLAFTSVVVAPRLQRRIGIGARRSSRSAASPRILVVMAVWTDHKAVLAVCVVVAGAFLGVNNTLVTETVMKAAPVERGVASAAYSFVRFSGGAVAPWLAGHLGETYGVARALLGGRRGRRSSPPAARPCATSTTTMRTRARPARRRSSPPPTPEPGLPAPCPKFC